MASGIDNRAEEFGWQAHPARERAGAAVLGAVLVFAVAGAIYVSFGSAWSVLALVVLTVALNRFYFKSRFEIDPEGITARYPLRSQRHRWQDVQRFVVDRNGGYLSTRSRRSWLDAYRGLHVLFGHDRASVIERIRSHLPAGGGS